MSDIELSSSSELSEGTEDNYDDIRPYFKEGVWQALSRLEKEAYRNQKERYDIGIANSE